MLRRLWPLILLLAGCSWLSDDKGIFVDRSDDYITVKDNPPLEIPADLEADRVQDPFPVPKISEPMRPEYFPGRPPQPDAIYANDNRDEVRIQRLGERRWLVVPEPPTSVWPKVKQFLADNGVPVSRERPGEGRLDTEWLTIGNQNYRDVVRLVLRDSREAAGITTGRDRFRIRVEQGLRERTSEVHIRHENDTFAAPGPDDLIDLNATPSHLSQAEQELLSELGAYIAAKVSEQTVSMVAQDIGSQVKSYLDRDAQGEPVLRLRLDYERAWATIGQSLLRASIEIDDSDESTGIYKINIPENLEVEDAKKPGFFRRLFSFGDDDYRELQLRLAKASDGTYEVYADDAEGKPLDRDFAQQVLVLLREYAA
ncbi:MAG: outer membrane protein assembly factor BamC [Pseudomonadales bacterium]